MPSLASIKQKGMSAPLTKCPICEQPVEGAAEELERHVNNHLDVGEEELSRRVAHELSEEPSTHDTQQTEATPQLPNENNVDEIDENLGPAERMMLEVERNDAALASAIAQSSPQINGNGVYVSQSLRGSLSDSAERYYPDVLRIVVPLYDIVELLWRKKCHLCSKLDLFSSNIAGLGWDCGYRNIQMMLSALLRSAETAAELTAAGITEVPSIPEIAGRIECGWKEGFDAEGAKHFGGTLTDKEVWIGATEAFVLLRSMNMNAYLHDFETPSMVQKKQVYEWIFKYFDNCCNGRNCSMHRKGRLGSGTSSMTAPLFCQWQGHSVTIVGAEKTRQGEIVLVILDPSRGFYTSLMADRSLHLLRRDINHPQFSHPRFQLVSVLPKQSPNVAPSRQSRKGVLGKLRLGGPS